MTWAKDTVKRALSQIDAEGIQRILDYKGKMTFSGFVVDPQGEIP